MKLPRNLIRAISPFTFVYNLDYMSINFRKADQASILLTIRENVILKTRYLLRSPNQYGEERWRWTDDDSLSWRRCAVGYGDGWLYFPWLHGWSVPSMLRFLLVTDRVSDHWYSKCQRLLFCPWLSVWYVNSGSLTLMLALSIWCITSCCLSDAFLTVYGIYAAHLAFGRQMCPLFFRVLWAESDGFLVLDVAPLSFMPPGLCVDLSFCTICPICPINRLFRVIPFCVLSGHNRLLVVSCTFNGRLACTCHFHSVICL